VSLAASGEEALQLLSQSPPFDLIITDLRMPEMSGKELALLIRERFARTDCPPIVLLSSVGRQIELKQAALFTEVLSKPLRQADLYNVLMQMLQPKKIVAPAEQVINTQEFAQNYPLDILVAEDNPVNQKLLLRMLTLMGYEAQLATNGQEAVDQCLGHNFDLVFMDVQMPVMDGLTATGKIQQLLDKPPVIVAITANAMQGDREMCLQAGMDGYLSKPFRKAELVELLVRFSEEIQGGQNEPAPIA
jgi:CheY-like chemotaxis protein